MSSPTKEELAADIAELMKDPDFAALVATAMEGNCKSVYQITKDYLNPFASLEDEDIGKILDAVEKTVGNLPKDDQQRFETLKVKIQEAGLTREAVINVAMDPDKAPDIIQQAGKTCFMKEAGLTSR